MPHASRRVAELIVMSRRQLEPLSLGKCDQSDRLFCVERERLLHVHVTAVLQALACDVEVARRWRGDVHHVRPGVREQGGHVGEMLLDGEPLVQLARHQRLTVAHADDLAAVDALDLGRVGVRDLAAADDGDLKHGGRPRGSS